MYNINLTSDTILLFFLVFILILVLYYNQNYNYGNIENYSSNLVSERDYNIQKNIGSTGKDELVLFHLEGCPHCDDLLKPRLKCGLSEFQELKFKMKQDFPNVCVYDLEYKNFNNDPKTFGIQGFPTIKLFKKNGEEIEYNGERKTCKIVSFIKNNL